MSDINTSEGIIKEHGRRKTFFDISRRVLLAGIGAMALAQDEIEDFVNKLVDRGEIAEKDGRTLIREIIEKRKSAGGKSEEMIDKRVREMMNRFDVPTKADIENLSKKISTLTKKVEDLQKKA